MEIIEYLSMSFAAQAKDYNFSLVRMSSRPGCLSEPSSYRVQCTILEVQAGKQGALFPMSSQPISGLSFSLGGAAVYRAHQRPKGIRGRSNKCQRKKRGEEGCGQEGDYVPTLSSLRARDGTVDGRLFVVFFGQQCMEGI